MLQKKLSFLTVRKPISIFIAAYDETGIFDVESPKLFKLSKHIEFMLQFIADNIQNNLVKFQFFRSENLVTSVYLNNSSTNKFTELMNMFGLM